MGGPCTCDGKVWHSMDNFSKTPFMLDGKTWISPEQYFQAKKFTDAGYIEKIRKETEGNAQWVLGQKRCVPIVTNWEEVKVDVMYDGNKAKFEQNPECMVELLSTKGPIKAVGFAFWVKWNQLILERIREESRPEPDQERVLHYRKLFDNYRAANKK
eukprot:TRINITY_DN8645_c0_g2_i1.p1 TRINITY_DN8645_c0_g2~~TRINITY_DN8645_c0_g2_i1.p1  ORF type:complete len:176 (+),score=42.24 TRINITY_DN8645_c0_g2_i1:60-530(+)